MLLNMSKFGEIWVIEYIKSKKMLLLLSKYQKYIDNRKSKIFYES